MEYSKLSYDLTKKISKGDKKTNGIFFTPPDCVNKNLELLKDYDIKNVLEPSCGSCEYILQLSKNKKLKITGIEFNKTIYEEIKDLSKNNIKLLNKDFLKFETKKLYDLIIGNPPYYVMKKGDVDSIYYDYFDGRPNIFILFIIKSLSLLSKNGILSFVLPKSFLNSFYYDKTRNYISKNFQILYIEESFDKYLETQQETIIFIVRKQDEINNKDYILNFNSLTIFGSKNMINELKELLKDSKSLDNLYFNVSVGKIVWNQHKNILTDDNSNTRLIYSSDIVDNNLVLKKYNNEAKHNYIKKEGINKLILVVNRGYGNGKYNFNYCIINVDYKYLVENHLICVEYKKKIEKKKLLKLYEKIIKSLNNKKTKRFVELYFGNNAITTTELNYILPIYGF